MAIFQKVHNIATGEISTLELDNAWVLTHQPPQIFLSLPKLDFVLGESGLLTAQLKTPVLTDGTQNDLTSSLEDVIIQIGDSIQIVSLVNGQWQDTVQFSLAGTFSMKCLSHFMNELIVEVL